MEEVEFSVKTTGWAAFGGIKGADFDNKPDDNDKDFKKYYTVTLQEILERTNAPSVIDYLSLDVEGK